MQDDVGNQVALPKVVNDAEVGRLVGAYVTVTGAPNVDPAGKLTHVEEASVELAPVRSAPGRCRRVLLFNRSLPVRPVQHSEASPA